MNTEPTTEQQAFRPLAPGVEMRLLRQHPGGGLTFLIRMKAGSRAPLHRHPQGEETYMLKGTLRVSHRTDASGGSLPDAEVHEGEYLFAPPGETHDGVAESDALFFVVAAGGVAPSDGRGGSRSGR